MWNLFIDDERNPQDVTWYQDPSYQCRDYYIARNWDEVLCLVTTLGTPNFISFDHDLGSNEKTGYEIAQTLCAMIMDQKLDMPADFAYTVHSKNPVGAANIRGYMNNFLEHYLIDDVSK